MDLKAFLIVYHTLSGDPWIAATVLDVESLGTCIERKSSLTKHVITEPMKIRGQFALSQRAECQVIDEEDFSKMVEKFKE